ncbi:MAG: hypothetical protein SVY41_01155 [Candidatus Nanohaloarchaea archaeon]|nr:hypothetical protein [Candidatus Nanohaloarchaea archaeon]
MHNRAGAFTLQKVVAIVILVILALAITGALVPFLSNWWNTVSQPTQARGTDIEQSGTVQTDNGSGALLDGVESPTGSGGSQGGSTGAAYDYETVQLCGSRTTVRTWKHVNISDESVRAQGIKRTTKSCEIGMDSVGMGEAVIVSIKCGDESVTRRLTALPLSGGGDTVSFAASVRESPVKLGSMRSSLLQTIQDAVKKDELASNLDICANEEPEITGIADISQSGWTALKDGITCSASVGAEIYASSCKKRLQDGSPANAETKVSCNRNEIMNCAAIGDAGTVCCQTDVTSASCSPADSCEKQYIGGNPTQHID